MSTLPTPRPYPPLQLIAHGLFDELTVTCPSSPLIYHDLSPSPSPLPTPCSMSRLSTVPLLHPRLQLIRRLKLNPGPPLCALRFIMNALLDAHRPGLPLDNNDSPPPPPLPLSRNGWMRGQ